MKKGWWKREAMRFEALYVQAARKNEELTKELARERAKNSSPLTRALLDAAARDSEEVHDERAVLKSIQRHRHRAATFYDMERR